MNYKIKGDTIKDKTFEKLYKICTVILIISIIQISLSLYQISRYTENVYDCSDMSIDCAKFFTSIGIKTRYVRGWYYNNISKNNNKSFHVWLELDFGLFKLPFESTTLLFISPTVIKNYNEIKVTDYYTNLTTTWGDDIFDR